MGLKGRKVFMPRSKGRLTLPDNPDLEQLREQAKERLAIIRTHAPEAQLSDAQFALARDYGFPGWRALKAEVQRRSGTAKDLVGNYACDETVGSNHVLSVTAKGERLFLERAGGVTTEIIRQPNGDFVTPGLTTRHRFELDSTGKARALFIESWAGAVVRAARIGVAQAARMRSEREREAKKEWSARTPIEVPEDVLERYVGHYANPVGNVMTFSREGRTLFIEIGGRALPLAAESEVDFFLAKARIEVHFRIKDDVATSIVFGVMGHATVMSRVSPEAAASLSSVIVQRAAEQAQPRQLAPSVPSVILARYAGRYRVENGMEMVVDVNEARIFAQMFMPIGTQPRFEIFPESESKFFWPEKASQVSFFADAEEKVHYGIWHQSGHLIPMSRIEDSSAKVAPAA
jgi:hypothetical protein